MFEERVLVFSKLRSLGISSLLIPGCLMFRGRTSQGRDTAVIVAREKGAIGAGESRARCGDTNMDSWEITTPNGGL